ncbi:uncharacterized protein LOC135834654 isoform X4 [Planococcus citri]|uniref:uncharacterized protein LOC135834654 isoform X4 n=1 Tax=Planococcus citri TaxID=170843 RepID=UPI0031F7E64F
MVKVKEFCCGCSLRSGTYIAAWGLLVPKLNHCLFTQVWSFYLCISAVYYFMFIQRWTTKTSSWLPYLLAYEVTRTTIGMTVSLIAIWALQKEILVIFALEVERSLSGLNPLASFYFGYGSSEDVALIFLIYLFGIGAASYFALIVKSYRDYSLRNEARNVQYVGPDATTIGYIRS